MNKLSIIVPCYNEENTILSAIDEIKEFKDLDKEIIIVDDGSSDGTRDLLKKIKGNFDAMFIITHIKESQTYADNSLQICRKNGCSLLQPLTKMQEHVAEGTILSLRGLWHAHACSYGSVPTVLWGTHTSSEACRLCLEVCSNWFILIAARWSETGKLRGRPTTRNLVPPDYSDVVSAPREKHSGCTIVLGYNQGRSQAN